MKTAGVDNLPCKADMEVTMVIPNVFEIWSMHIVTDKHVHRFRGLTIFGYAFAYKDIIREAHK